MVRLFPIVLLKAHMTNRSLKLDFMKQEKDSSFLEGYLAMYKKLVGARISVTNKGISTVKTIH